VIYNENFIEEVFLMVQNLKSIIYEKLKSNRHIYDVDLINEIEKLGQKIDMKDLNKVLLQLEILGLLTVRWVTKGKRRIEIIEIKNDEKINKL
jgi:hypothetical protein